MNIPAAGIFDQKTQVIGGENTVTVPLEPVLATQQNQALISGEISGGAQQAARISIPPTEVTRLSSAQPEKKRSRAWLGIGAAAVAATLLAGVCAAALYVYKPELFRQNENPVNSITTENSVPNDAASQGAKQDAAAQATGAENITGGQKESAVKTIEPKANEQGKTTGGEKAAAKTSGETGPNTAVDPDETDMNTDDAEFNAKQKEFQKAVNNMVQKRLKQANIKNRQIPPDAADEGNNGPPNPNVRIYRPGDPNLPPPHRPFYNKRKRP